MQRRLRNLPELQTKARAVNRRILDVQRAGQGCAIGPTLFERIQQPYNREGQRTGALRFGDPRAMALAGALCLTLHAVTGVTNRSLRALVAGLLGIPYSSAQASYDLRRLRVHGLIRRIDGRNRYALTDDGLTFAVFYTKLGDRVMPPLFAVDRLEGLVDAPRPGARRTVTDDVVEAVVVDTLETAPKDATHWSTRGLADKHGISKTTVAEIWRAFGLKPWKQDSFKVSPDPELVEKVRDIVGLYLNPPVRHEAPIDRVG